MASALKNFSLVRTAGLKGLVIEYGNGKRQDGFYKWEDIGENEAAYLFSIGSPYVVKVTPEETPAASTPEKTKASKKPAV